MRVSTLRQLVLLFLLFSLLIPAPAGAQSGAPGALRIAAPLTSAITAQGGLPDPITVPPEDLAGRDLIENLFVGLFRYDAAAGEAVPILAESWTVSADGLTWTFTLRQDIPWVRYSAASGEVEALRPVVAADFVAGLRRACHPLKPTPAGTIIFVIRGCYAAVQSDPILVTDEQVNRLVAAEAPEPTTLVLHLAFPTTYLPALLTAPAFRPIPREFVDFTTAWPAQATSGPYVVTASAPGESLTLTRSPFWPDALPGSVTDLEIAYVPDPVAAVAAGEADFARRFAPGAESLVARGRTVSVLGFSLERTWVSEPGVRQALAWSLDRAALVADDPAVLPVTTLTHPAAVGAGALEGSVLGADVAAARQALAAAGYPNCAGVPEIIGLAVPPERQEVAQRMVARWEEALGCQAALFSVVTVRAEALQNIGRALIDMEVNNRIHMWLATYTPEYVDAQAGAADALHCRYGFFQRGGPCDAGDALIDWAVATPVEDRGDVYRRIEARLFGPAGTFPVVPLYANALAADAVAGLSGITLEGAAWWGDWSLTP